jgi:hypothetical protein
MFRRIARLTWVFPLTVLIAACSSDPESAINRSPLIRRMDSFFSGGETDGITPPQAQRQDIIKAAHPHPAY